MSESKIIGVVLCGGRSTRMGQDKGSMQKGDRYWCQIVLNAFNNVGLPTTLSVNSDQLINYKLMLPGEELIVDSYEIGGPLNGLFSVHDQYPESDLFLLATDMIDIQVDSLSGLVEQYDGDLTAWTNDGFVETLCAIYPAKVLKDFKEKFFQAESTDLSLRQLFNMYPSDFAEVPESLADTLKNYNTLKD